MPTTPPNRQSDQPGPVFAHHGDLITSPTLASRWHVSVGHLANERSAGTSIPYLKIGARVLYRMSDVLAAEAAALVEPVA